MTIAGQPAIYRILWDQNLGGFYLGDGKWTVDRQQAKVFGSLAELGEECRLRGITSCTVIELSPRPHAFGLRVEAP